MKYIKTYENMVNDNLEVHDGYYWILNGIQPKVIKILDKIELKLDEDNDLNFVFKKIKLDLTHWTEKKKWLGCYLYYNDDRFKYWVFNNVYDKKRADEYNLNTGYKFQGELKIKNKELVLDKLPVDINKYNL